MINTVNINIDKFGDAEKVDSNCNHKTSYYKATKA